MSGATTTSRGTSHDRIRTLSRARRPDHPRDPLERVDRPLLADQRGRPRAVRQPGRQAQAVDADRRVPRDRLRAVYPRRMTMPNATVQQVQQYADQRIRPRAEQIRALILALQD